MTAPSTDPMTAVRALRPEATTLDPAWSEATLAAIMAAPRGSARAGRVTSLRRRTAKIVAGAAGVTALGVGAAAAAGVSPASFATSFAESFAGWSYDASDDDRGPQPVDPLAAERVATEPGPGGTMFSLVESRGTGGFACVAVLFERPASLRSPLPDSFVDANGSACDDLPPGTGFGEIAGTDVQRLPRQLGEPEISVFSASAGTAVRAELRAPDGTTSPVLLHDGRFYGWYVGEPGPQVLVGFAADGGEVGRLRP